jgi:hypothetical protein
MRLEIDFAKLLENFDPTFFVIGLVGISCIYALATIVIMMFLKGSK